ncbi:hypothetical protein PO485_26875, partial [Klebsiella pneumoniae]
MQRKLATWAATDPSLRIQRLLRLITQPEWLAEAARITLSSKGAHTPGVDGVNKTMLQARLAVELQILRDELLSGHYQPLPARRHCCKVSDEAAFCLIQRPYISKTLLT